MSLSADSLANSPLPATGRNLLTLTLQAPRKFALVDQLLHKPTMLCCNQAKEHDLPGYRQQRPAARAAMRWCHERRPCGDPGRTRTCNPRSRKKRDRGRKIRFLQSLSTCHPRRSGICSGIGLDAGGSRSACKPIPSAHTVVEKRFSGRPANKKTRRGCRRASRNVRLASCSFECKSGCLGGRSTLTCMYDRFERMLRWR